MIAYSALTIILGALLVVPVLIDNHKTNKLNRIGLCIGILGIFMFAGGLGSKYYLKNKIYNQYFNRTDMQQILKSYPQAVITNDPNCPNSKSKKLIVLVHEKTKSSKTYNVNNSPIFESTNSKSDPYGMIFTPYTSSKNITVQKTNSCLIYTKDIFKKATNH